ncbi:MAG: hypothetical protein KAT68_18255 [Bacteroidales bacterium]|nr:hypothetical protein [Bacteroidales bacterium]
MESLKTILLGGLGGALIAPLITILYDRCKHIRKEKNLFKGFISEMGINKEYLKHNHDLAGLIQKEGDKPSIFIPARNEICTILLNSGDLKIDKKIRKQCNHYLVTLDHHNQMISTIERLSETSKEYDTAIERIKRYCRLEQGNYSEKFDYVSKHIDNIKSILIIEKRYLKKYLN